MQLAEISIRRPVFATVLSLLVLLVGAVSFTRLTVREYPKIDEPVVTVSVRYAGASAEVIESQVTKPLEDSIAGIDAVDVITSISRAEQSQISVRFRLEKDADNAAAEVRDRTARVRNRLPDAVDEPVIAKVEADASPVMWLAFSSDTRSPLEINDLLNRIVKPRLQTGLDPFSAAIKGAREIGFAIIAMTLTLVAVYAPLAFTPGRTGRLFVEFALALAGAVVVSGFVALTLSPMMCSLLLKHNPNPNWFDRSMERWLTALSDAYGRLLRWVVTARWGGRREDGSGGGLRGALFQARWLVVAVMLVSGAGLVAIYPKMKQELSPMEDRGTILVNVTAPDGATLDYTNRYALELEKIGREYPEFDRIFANIGNPTVAQGSVIYRTVDWEQRERSTLAMARDLQPKVAALPGVNSFLITPPSLGQGFRSRPLTYVIQTSDSYENLNAVTNQMMAEIAKNPGIIAPDVDLRLNKPELRISVNRERAADLGVSVDVVAKAIETMLGGRTVTRYKRDAEQYDVIVQTEARGRTTPENIDSIYVRGRNDAMIPLSSLVNVKESVSPRELNHFGQRRSVTITANLSPDYSLGEALTFMDSTAAKVLKPGYTTDLNGTSREFKSSQGALGIVF
eukprot:gene7236-7080_t